MQIFRWSFKKHRYVLSEEGMHASRVILHVFHARLSIWRAQSALSSRRLSIKRLRLEAVVTKRQRRGCGAESSHEVSGTEEAASLPEPRRRARARGVAVTSEPMCFPHVVRRASCSFCFSSDKI